MSLWVNLLPRYDQNSQLCAVDVILNAVAVPLPKVG